jgi:type I restriction enzyme, S subunit
MAGALENLPLLAEAPGGIERLRVLILDLAATGRLIGHSAAATGTQSLHLPALPVHWRYVPFNELIDPERPIAYGVLVPGPALPGGVPFVRIADLSLKSPAPLPEKTISPAVDAQYSRTKLRGGEILMGVVGSVGKLGIAPMSWAGANIARAICRIVPKEGVAKNFVVMLLQSSLLRQQFLSDTRTLAQPTLNVGLIRSALAPLPPLSEQHRIVAKFDELMALCDRLEARQQDAEAAHARLVQALLDSLTQARDADEFQARWQRMAGQFDVMFTTDASVDALKLAVCQLGVSGRLVQPSGTGTDVAKLVAALALHWQKRSPRRAKLAAVPEAVQRYPVPSSWSWLNFGFVAETRLGKMLDAAKNTGELKPYLRNTNVQWDRFELDDLKELRLEASELDEFTVKAGDLLICEGGEPGRCAVWRDGTREIYFQKALHRARPLGGMSSDYLKVCLQVDAATGVLSRLFTGATIQHLTGEKLERYAVAVPPQEEQRRIVAKVTELLALCDQLKARIAAARAKHAQLAEALVVQAVAA